MDKASLGYYYGLGSGESREWAYALLRWASVRVGKRKKFRAPHGLEDGPGPTWVQKGAKHSCSYLIYENGEKLPVWFKADWEATIKAAAKIEDNPLHSYGEGLIDRNILADYVDENGCALREEGMMLYWEVSGQASRDPELRRRIDLAEERRILALKTLQGLAELWDNA